MRKGRSIIGAKVISQADGADLGHVKDLIFDHEIDEVLALLLSEKDLFGLIDAQVVPWEQVRSIGPDAIVVESQESKVKAGHDPRVSRVMDRNTALSGTHIYTTEGQELGTLADMFIDEATGRIVGYEVSGGFVNDTISGKRFLPMPRELSIGRDVALVPPQVGEELELQRQEEPGGLQAAASTATAKASDALSGAASKISDTYANIAQASVEKQREFVIGKTASRDVIIPADRTAPALPAASSTSEVADFDTTVTDTTFTDTTVTDTSDTTVSETIVIAPTPTADNVTGSELTVPTTAGATDISSSGEVVEGEVLVRKGEIITAEHADRAIEANILGQLVAAAVGSMASEAYTTSRERVSGVVATGSEHAGGVGASLQERAEAAALGKIAGRDVIAPDGSIIVASGMTITPEILAHARVYDLEREVIASAGLGAATHGAQTLRDSATETATGLWETVKHKASELAETIHEKKDEYDAQAEQSRINRALGRPVTRVILDQSDHVVLNTGDIITHAAVNRAREAGVLDVLLDSVYIVEPEITPEMMRAEEPGEAALSTQAEPTGGPITATVAPDQPAQDTPSQGRIRP